jgi:peroxiredoxin
LETKTGVSWPARPRYDIGRFFIDRTHQGKDHFIMNKVVFAIIVVALIGALAFAVTYQPKADRESASEQTNVSTKVENNLPRAENVSLSTAPVGLEIGNRAPDWSLKDPSGNIHSLQDYLGQVVVLDYWATWCGPCIKIMPDLQKFHEKYQSRGVNVIGMNGSERGGNPAKFMADKGFTYQLLVNTDLVMQRQAPNGIPQLYVIGVDGVILHKHLGYSPGVDKELADIIEPHLEKHGL